MPLVSTTILSIYPHVFKREFLLTERFRKLPSSREVADRRRRGLDLLQSGANNSGDARVDARIAILSTFNVDLLPPLLVEALDRYKLGASVYTGGFGQMVQEGLNPGSGLYQSEPNAVMLIPSIEDLLDAVFTRPNDFTSQEKMDDLIARREDELASVVTTLLERLPDATCFISAISPHRVPMTHVLDPKAPERGQESIKKMHAMIRRLSDLSSRVVLVDWDWGTRQMGGTPDLDERLWYLARMRLEPVGLAALAEILAEHVAAYRGVNRKVAVIDLDETMWGGIVGEAGLEGIVIGDEGVGLAFRDFQIELRKLHDMGVVLAICSKNDQEVAWQVFERHSGMILKRDHFAAAQINWDDKATNLKRISKDLGLGLESFVFIDDNPVEREWVKSALPEVLVPDLPEDPVYRPKFLRQLSAFRRVMLTDADLQRADSYKAEGKRKEHRAIGLSMDEFIESLDQEIAIEEVNEGSVTRAAQMTQRTNQFNLTTQRYVVSDLEKMRSDSSVQAYTVAVKDRFGDSGITGLVILRIGDENAEIDTFLLSCRVLGRRVENVLLEFMTDQARAGGAQYLIGRYISTERNGQVAEMYSDAGFETVGDGIFQLDLSRSESTSIDQLLVKVKDDG
jgi:FkbH-like protein